MLLEILGISKDRIIYGSVVADIVYIPRPMAYANSLKNAYEVRLLAKILLKRALPLVKERGIIRENILKMDDKQVAFDLKHRYPRLDLKPVLAYQIDHPQNYDPSKKNLVILARTSDRQNGQSWGYRTWSIEDTNTLVERLKLTFINHNIVLHRSDSIHHPAFCMACEIIEVSKADILLGLHGAGMTKEMFLPTGGSLVFEMSNAMSDVVMPVCGEYLFI